MGKTSENIFNVVSSTLNVNKIKFNYESFDEELYFTINLKNTILSIFVEYDDSKIYQLSYTLKCNDNGNEYEIYSIINDIEVSKIVDEMFEFNDIYNDALQTDNKIGKIFKSLDKIVEFYNDDDVLNHFIKEYILYNFNDL